jgi:hypothetical protein
MPVLDTSFLNNVTREHFLPTLKNQLYNTTALMNRLFAKGRVKTMTGRSLLWDVVAKKHSSLGVYQGYDTLANQPINPTVQASLPIANYYATLAISKDEERRNSGSMEKLLDMLKVQMDNASSSLKDRMATDIYSDGTQIAGRDILIGLAAAVNSGANPPVNTYANIARTAANAYWRNNSDITAYTLADLKDPTTASWLPHVMRTAVTNASHAGSQPDLIVTTKAIYNLYQDIAVIGNLRFNNDVANLGFGGVEFGAGITMIFDDYCPANMMYFLTTDDWSVFVFPDADFSMQEAGWIIPPDQIAKVTHLLWSGQIRCESPWKQSVLSSVGAS